MTIQFSFLHVYLITFSLKHHTHFDFLGSLPLYTRIRKIDASKTQRLPDDSQFILPVLELVLFHLPVESNQNNYRHTIYQIMIQYMLNPCTLFVLKPSRHICTVCHFLRCLLLLTTKTSIAVITRAGCYKGCQTQKTFGTIEINSEIERELQKEQFEGYIS